MVRFSNPVIGKIIVHFSKQSRPALRPVQPSVGRAIYFLGVKRPGLDADHSSRYSAEVSEQNYVYAFPVCLHGWRWDSFIFSTPFFLFYVFQAICTGNSGRWSTKCWWYLHVGSGSDPGARDSIGFRLRGSSKMMYLEFSLNRILSVHTDRFATAGSLIGKASIFALTPEMC